MRHYVAIDLKSFYASVECVDRGLDPLTARLVVADESRTAKTICLAVSPALKAYGIPGRARLFEVNKKAKEASIDFIIAPPRMARYVEVSTQIYEIYLKYVSHDDMHVYSIDEVFIDVTDYLDAYKMTPEELAMTMIKDVLSETGVTATAGIGTNMYLAKIAMDIVAKHAKADENGVRMASLDEMSYRKELWNHRPLTDFWRVGRGYEKRLNSIGLYTMGDVARCSLGKETDYFNEDLLYRIFGVNAELLIDHAWGYEPCTMAEIHAYKPETNSISTGQVLHCPYDHEKTRLIVKEMMELLSLDLVEKRLKTKQIVLNIGYDIENITNKDILKKYEGEVVVDHYGRKIPKGSHGTENLDKYTSSGVVLTEAVLRLYDRITNPDLLVRRLNIVACNVVTESVAKEKEKFVQMDLFSDFGFGENSVEQGKSNPSKDSIAELDGMGNLKNYFYRDEDRIAEENRKEQEKEERERKVQLAALEIKKKFGKNAILKGMNLEDGGTTIDRNAQIGGHKA